MKNAWLYRRVMAFIITFHTMAMQWALVSRGASGNAIHEIFAEATAWLLIGIFAIYVGGASADDLLSLRFGQRPKDQRQADRKDAP